MKVVIVYGSPRKGNTFGATQFFKEEMQKQGRVEFTEVFLPRDLPEFCCGCMTCFLKGEERCPNASYTLGIVNTLVSADALFFTTPVFALSLSGAMKSFLDHFAYMFIVHRPKEQFFIKKAFILASTVGAGTKAASKTIDTSLRYWGINRVYSYSFATFGEEWADMKDKKKKKIERGLRKKAVSFYKEVASKKRHRPYLWIWFMFLLRKMLMKKYDPESSLDRRYWIEKGWYGGGKSPFRD